MMLFRSEPRRLVWSASFVKTRQAFDHLLEPARFDKKEGRDFTAQISICLMIIL